MLFPESIGVPCSVRVLAGTQSTELSRSGREFGGQLADSAVTVEFGGTEGLSVRLSAPTCGISQIVCRWRVRQVEGAQILNDHWERGYGDLAWRGYSAMRMLPWYFLVHDGKANRTCGVGVQVQPNAFCFWTVTPYELTLVCDVRNGTEPVRLGSRSLEVCTIQVKTYEEYSPFTAACSFCRLLSPRHRTPPQPVYGFNDWYYIYGKNSAETFRRDAQTLAGLTDGLANRPYCVIDAGWQILEGGCSGGPLDYANRKFGDMEALAREAKAMGVRPGIWMRPLMTHEDLPEGVKLSPSLLDPSHPEALRYIEASIRHLVEDWGYELVKHDFSTFDVFGQWGFQMLGMLGGEQTMRFRDGSRTTAEIILALYRAIRNAAGDAVVIGCNTVGHLAAGLVEVQRTGDDTSGRDWARTLKMGVNTLAFRMPQQGSFFAVDADCVGITAAVPWELNRQWLDLLSQSGTPLFVSAAPDALGEPQRQALRDAFALAACRSTPAEPLDWLYNRQPHRWQTAQGVREYDWYTAAPVALGVPSGDNLF